MKKFTLLFLLLFAGGFLFAQSWKFGSGMSSGVGEVFGDHTVAVDVSGNVCVVGEYYSYLVYGTDTLHNTEDDFFIAKYDASGNALWARQTDSLTGRAFPTSVTADGAGNYYTCGVFTDTVGFSFDTLTSPPGIYEAFITKYDSYGNVMWAHQSTGITNPNYQAVAKGIVADAAGNTYVCGYFTDNITFGSITLNSGGSGSFLVKYNTRGDVVWAKQVQLVYPIYSTVFFNSLALDDFGNIYIEGSLQGTIVMGSNTYTSFLPAMLLAKYDTAGNAIWAQQATVSGNYDMVYSTSVAVDGPGNVYVTGDLTGSASFGSFSLSSNVQEVFLAKYDRDGNGLWVQSGADNAYSYSVICDTLKRGGGYLLLSYVASPTGSNSVSFAGKSFGIDPKQRALTLVLQFDSLGTSVCGTVFSEGTEDDGDGMGTNRSGKNIVIGGDIENDTVILGPDTLTVVGGEDPFIACWQPCAITKDTTIQADTNVVVKEKASCIYVPSAFSPNGDHINDMEYAYGSCINTMDFTIFDRWGNKVFESESPAYGWDGIYKGQAMNTGTYVYYLVGTLQDGTPINKKGNIALVR